VDGWKSDEHDDIIVGRRRMRAGRRRTPTSRLRWPIIGIVVLLVLGGAVYGVLWLRKPRGLAALPNPTVATPGGFRASIGSGNTITVGLQVRNVANVPITLTQARIVAPTGLSGVAITLVPTGEDNQGFALDGTLPVSAPVRLGTDVADRNAIIVARFVVDCGAVPANGVPGGEQIFVTVEVDQQQREEELTPPAVGTVPWLTATARRMCTDPLPTTSAKPQLPPLPG
jgi:hypothetical protein